MALLKNEKWSKFVRILLPVVIVLLAIMGAQALIATRPTVPKTIPVETSTFVKVFTAYSQNERAIISAFGTVKASRELTVQPEVGGRVVTHHPDLIAGGVIAKGTPLLRIDPRDFQVAVDEERAALAKAEFELQVELGNQAVAKREWDLLKLSSGEISKLSKTVSIAVPPFKRKACRVGGSEQSLAESAIRLTTYRVKSSVSGSRPIRIC